MTPRPDNFWGGLTPAYIVSIFLIDIPFCLIDPSLWQRASAARDASIVKRSMFATAGVYLYWSLIVVFLGVAATRLFPGLAGGSSGDAVIPMEITHYLPPAALGLCMAAMLAIMMSTASTALLISGTTFGQDIVKAFRPATVDRSLLLITRIFIICIGAAGMLFALAMRGIFDILLLAFAIFVSGIFIPAMAAIFWKKATAAGAVSSAIAASITVVALYGLKLGGMLPPWMEPIIASLAVSLVVMVTVSRATWKESNATPPLLQGKK
jgi:Na+/proline symporter